MGGWVVVSGQGEYGGKGRGELGRQVERVMSCYEAQRTSAAISRPYVSYNTDAYEHESGSRRRIRRVQARDDADARNCCVGRVMDDGIVLVGGCGVGSSLLYYGRLTFRKYDK